MKKILLLIIFTLFINSLIYATLPSYLPENIIKQLEVGCVLECGNEEWEVVEVEGPLKEAPKLFRDYEKSSDEEVTYFFSATNIVWNEEKKVYDLDHTSPLMYCFVKFVKKI
jgi:hypothetical protein